MRKTIALLAVGFLLAVGGCKSDNKDETMSSSSSSEPKKMTTDVCSHCPGVQTATSDGKCSGCQMKL